VRNAREQGSEVGFWQTTTKQHFTKKHVWDIFLRQVLWGLVAVEDHGKNTSWIKQPSEPEEIGRTQFCQFYESS
jgi:hypothetical protein